MTTDSAAESIEVRRKRLRFRSWHRGTREADLIMGAFADRIVPQLTAEQLDRYEALLDVPDLDVYNWVTGREAVPAEHDSDVVRLLLDFTLHRKHT